MPTPALGGSAVGPRARRSSASVPGRLPRGGRTRSGAPWRSPSRAPAPTPRRSRPPPTSTRRPTSTCSTAPRSSAPPARAPRPGRGWLRRGVGDGRQVGGPAASSPSWCRPVTPGMKLVGLREEARHPRLGHRDPASSRTAACRPRTCSARAEVKKRDAKKKATGDKGFKGAMATFDASRPIVAAMAVGVGRAALDFVKEELERQGVRDPLRRAAHASSADRDRARRDGDGGRAPGRAAAHLARGQHDEPQGKPNNLEASHGQGQGRPRGHQDHPEGRRTPRPARLLEEAAGREVDARRQDQRHLRSSSSPAAFSTIRRRCCARSAPCP